MSEKLETRSIKCSGLQVRKAGESDKPAVIEGYAMRFDEESVYLTSYGDKFVEIMDRQCYSQEKADKTDIKMTLFHNREKLLARSDKGTGSMTLTVDDQGLKFSFEVPDTEFGKFAEEAVRRGDIKGCSIGFMTNEYDTSTRLNDSEKDIYDVVVRQKDIEIFELTLESDPAYPSTSVELRGKENVSEMLDKQKAADADALYLRKLLQQNLLTRNHNNFSDMSKIKDLEKRRGELEAKIEGIRSAITNENRAMTAEERSMVERTELELRGITREIADEVAQEQLRRMPAPAVDANVQFRSFLKSAQPGVNYNMELRGITLAGGGNAVQGISVQDIVDTDRNEPDLFGVLGISIPTGISGNAIQWPYCGGVTVKIQNELAESTEVTPDLYKQTAVPVRLTTCVKISNQTIENSSADLLGFVKTAIRKALMKKLTFAACSTTKASSSFYGGFAETGKQTGTYTNFTYKTAGEMIGKLAAKGIPVDGTTAFVMGGDLFWELKTTPRDNGSGLMVIDDNNRMLGLPVVACNDINRSEEGGVAGTGNVGLANFGYLPVVNHGNIRMSVDNSSATAANIDATIITINADFSMTVMKEFQDAFVLYSKS